MTTALIIAALVGTPLGFNLIPPDVELAPPAKAVECTADMTTFSPDPTPFEKEIAVKAEKTEWKLRPGILLSECGFLNVINVAAEHKRMKLELATLTSLKATRTAQWTLAEESYQNTIVKLQDDLRDANAPSFWEEWDGPVMYALGVLTAGLVVWGAVEVLEAR